MKKALIILMAVALLITPVMAQDIDESVADLRACEELMTEAANQLDALEMKLIETEAELKKKKAQGSYMTPLRGTLQTIPIYRKQKAYVQVGIAALLDGLILAGMTYVELVK